MMKCIKVSSCLLGAIIGAGFASGKELVSFLSVDGLGVWSAIIVATLVFVFCFVFLSVAQNVKAKTVTETNKEICKSLAPFFSIMIILNSLIILSAMTAALGKIGSDVWGLGIPITLLGSVLVGVLLLCGRAGLFGGNIIMVFAIALLISFIAILSITPSDLGVMGGLRPFRALFYVALNMLLGASICVTEYNLTKKQRILTSAIAATVLGALVLVLSAIINANRAYTNEMPILLVCKQLGKPAYYSCIALLILSILTTMLSCGRVVYQFFYGYLKNKLLSVFVTFSVSISIGQAGFGVVVDYLYPVIGVVGLLYFVVSLKKLLPFSPHKLFNNGYGKIHKSGKKTEYNG